MATIITILSLLSITTFLSLTTSLTFKITNFNQTTDTEITYEGKAARNSDDGFIQITAVQNFNTGRITYSKPVHLHHNATRNLTSFKTHFAFVIDSNDQTPHGDGFAFFLAPTNFPMPSAQDGRGLGLVSGQQIVNSTDYPFVAVEFDAFQSEEWDQNGTHIGIDISSLISVSNVTWVTNIAKGEKNEAWIDYDSRTFTLSVWVTGLNQSVGISHIVDLRDVLPEWVEIGFSAATGLYPESHTIQSWSFESSLEVANATDVQKGSTKKSGLVLGLSVGGVVVVLGILGLVLGILVWRKKRQKQKDDEYVVDESMDDEFEKGTGAKKFSHKELARATSDFAESEKLGEGGFGCVYRGFLKSLDSNVAVKRVSRGSKQGMKEYASEVRIISRLRHKNLVQLIGWSHENKELLLVYELMPNGSLDSHLFNHRNSLLTWDARYKIAQGLASALLYLHEEWDQCVLHRDIKSSNVMLDSNFNAKLGDFGLARLVDHGKDSQTTVLAGTLGYMALECVLTRKSSRESDVYSFGVVALEIACGRKPVQVRASANQVMLVNWVWELYGQDRIFEAVDPNLSEGRLFDDRQMERLIIVGLWCAHPDCNSRPSMRQVIHVLNFEAPLPDLPLQMPVATYSAPLPASTFSVSTDASTQSLSTVQISSNTGSPRYSAHSASSSTTFLYNIASLKVVSKKK